ncbi:MAG: hypothetical protein ACREDK_02235 [Thermoplasmata archaeon]
MPAPFSLTALLTLRGTRRNLRRSGAGALAATIGIVYAFVSMLVGQMLFFEPIGGQYFAEVVWNSGSSNWWNYPGLLVVQPWGILALPFFGTIVMTLVSVGVGVGMTSAVYLGVQLLRARRRGRVTGSAGAGAIAGLSPALISLVTLGACCSTTAAALAGLGWTAVITGTSVNALIVSNWYPGVFQLAILYVALVAQEQLIVAYGWTLGSAADAGDVDVAPTPTVPRAVRLLQVGVRGALLIGGVTWLLALPAEWTRAAPPALSVATLFGAIGQHLIPGLLAVGAALAPMRVLSAVRAVATRRIAGAGTRAVLVALGASLLGWFPAPLASAGVVGWGNEILGAIGFPPSWGAIVPPYAGLALGFHWGLQLGMVGGFLLLLGARPRFTGRILGEAPSPFEGTQIGRDTVRAEDARTMVPSGLSLARPPSAGGIGGGAEEASAP